MTIPSETIDRVRLSTDIVELVKEYVPGLKRSGRNWKANCPFHNEKTPSFMVNAEKGIFHCFGCHAGGDAFKFVMMMDSSSWPEAVRKLGGRAGIAIEETKNDIIKRSEKQEIYDVLEQAEAFYHRVLNDSPEAALARKYLAKRGVNAESIKKFRLGFAPQGRLLEKASKKGFSAEQLATAGLLTKTERGTYFEYMSDRLVFPIHDTQGRVVAFGGRTLKDDQPKYLNSPETAVYSKSFQLYGLFQALPTLRKKADAMVLEGYMDVVVSHQFGVTNTVATLGTALTQQQARILKRYSDRAILLFDSDSAGENAAKRAIETLLETELPVSVAAMPDGVDPDEYLLKNGSDGFLGLVESSGISAEEFLVAQTVKVHGLNTPDSKVSAAADIIPYLEKIKNAVLRSEWIKYVSERLGITEEAFLAEWNRSKISPVNRKPAADLKKETARGNVRSAEEEILQLVCACPELLSSVREDYFKDERNRGIFSRLNDGLSPSRIIEDLTDENANWLTELMMEDKSYLNPSQVLLNVLKDIKKVELETQRKKLESEVNRMLAGQIPMDDIKVQKYNELNKQLKGSVKI